MDNLIFGIITIVLCTVGYFYSWRFQSRDNFRIAILLLIICGLILRIYVSTDFYLHTWDERYHALVAKNLINHPLSPTLYENPILPYDYKDWTANNIWLHKQPLPLWTMATSLWIFGINEIAVRLPSILFTTIGIWMTFRIASYFFNNKIGYLSAFFYSINGLIIELTGGRAATDHVDICFLFFIELAILLCIQFAQKQKTIFNILAGLAIGAAILSKWLPALIVLPIWLLIVSDSGNFTPRKIMLQFIVLVTTCSAIFLPWQFYIFSTYPAEANWEASLHFKHVTDVLEGRAGPVYYFLDKLRINYGELIYIPLLWFSWKLIKNFRDKKRLSIFIWFFVPLLFFSFVQTKMQAYILFTCPALFMITAEFWLALSVYRNTHKHKWLIGLILILVIVLQARYTIERTKPFEKMDRNPNWVVDLKKLNERQISKGVLLNYDRPIEAMFYTNLIAYSYIPKTADVAKLISDGNYVIIFDDGDIPDDIRRLPGVSIERFIAPTKE